MQPVQQPLSETVRSLGRRLDARTREIHDVAAGCTAGGDSSWDALLSSLDVPALAAAERLEHLASGMPLRKGALPIEVRRAMDSVRASFAAEASRLSARVRASDDPDLDDAALDELLNRVQTRLRGLVDAEVKRYVQAVRPPSGADIATVECAVCGVARVDGATLESCTYCGTRFS